MNAYGFLDIATTPSVRAAQAEMGADRQWAAFEGDREFDRFTRNEAAFIAARDSFYMGSVSEDGWPYVQHRGGPAGFLKLVDERTLAFADYRGNPPVYQHRQSRRQRPGLPDPDGLSPAHAAEDLCPCREAVAGRRSGIDRACPRSRIQRPGPGGSSGCDWRRSTGIARSTSPRASRNGRSNRRFVPSTNIAELEKTIAGFESGTTGLYGPGSDR